MGLKAPTTNNTNRIEQEPIEPGTYQARIVQIIDLGVQPQREFKGQAKPPAQEILVTYELLDEFMKDENGEEMTDKPRWVSERFALRSINSDLAKSTKRYKALTDDPSGDFTLLINVPCMVTITQSLGKNGKTYNNVASVSKMRAKDAEKAPPLLNSQVIFSIDEPDNWNDVAEWIQKIIKGNIHYEGSKLKDFIENNSKEENNESTVRPAPDLGESKPW